MPAFKKVKRSSGGRELITPELIEAIVNALRAGSYIETAAACAGIHKSTLHLWLKKGRTKSGKIKTSTPYGALIVAVEKAQAEATMRDLYNIDTCAMGQEWEYERHPDGSFDENGNDISGHLILRGGWKGTPIVKKIGLPPDWHASAWRLERKNPKEWGRTDKVEHSGKDGGPIQTAKTIKPDTPEEKVARRERIKDKIRILKILDNE